MKGKEKDTRSETNYCSLFIPLGHSVAFWFSVLHTLILHTGSSCGFFFGQYIYFENLNDDSALKIFPSCFKFLKYQPFQTGFVTARWSKISKWD